jgi:hypothetical protein
MANLVEFYYLMHPMHSSSLWRKNDMKNTTRVYSLLLLLISLMVFADVASAQPSLIFQDPDGRRVEFTRFGTIVHSYQGQNIVLRGFEVVYGDNLSSSGLRAAWYLSSSFNYGIVPVALSSDQSDEQLLSYGTRVSVRAVVRTADGRLMITHQYNWRVGSGRITSRVTVTNSSGSSLRLNEVSIYTARTDTPPPANACPCDPLDRIDGLPVASSIVTIPPAMTYLKTTASFPPLSLPPGGSDKNTQECVPLPDTFDPDPDCGDDLPRIGRFRLPNLRF